MFTPGRIVFVIFFVILFIGGMAWAYRKDLKAYGIQYRGVLKVLTAIIILFSLLFLIVKLRSKF